MTSSFIVTAFIGLFFIFIQKGNALQCWKCSSELDITCRDYFNITRIHQNRRYLENMDYNNRQLQPVRTEPHLSTCDEMFTSSYDKKNVCLKRVYTASNGMEVVRRECQLVSKNMKAGECPPDVHQGNRVNVNFCQSCDYDGCNAATSIKTSLLATSLPIILFFFARK